MITTRKQFGDAFKEEVNSDTICCECNKEGVETIRILNAELNDYLVLCEKCFVGKE